MPFVRDIFTGELIERPATTEGRQIIARTSVPENAPKKTYNTVWSRPWSSGMSAAVPIEQMAEFNEKAELGARYVPGQYGHAYLECDSRQARARELARRDKVDLDGCCGDIPRFRKRRRRAEIEAPAVPTPEDIVERYVDPDHVGTHYVGCWKNHVVCAILFLVEEIARLRQQLADARNERDCA